jgi:hypothetical protein
MAVVKRVCGLAVKLRGSPEAPDQSREVHTVLAPHGTDYMELARVARLINSHGRSKRWLEDALSQLAPGQRPGSS